MTNDITARLALDARQFSAEFRTVTDRASAQAAKVGTDVKAQVGGAFAGVADDFKIAGADITGTLDGIDKKALAVGAGIAGFATVAIGGVINLGKEMIALGDQIQTAADRANISVERYQTLAEGLQQLEISGRQTDQIFEKLASTLGQVQGDTASKGVTEALRAMGVESRILSGEIRTTDQLLEAIAESAANFSSQAEFTASVVAVVGQEIGVKLATALKDGGAALREAEERFRALGGVIDEDFIARLAEAEETIRSFTSISRGLLVNWAADAVGALDRVIERLGKLSTLELQSPAALALAAFRGGRDASGDRAERQRERNGQSIIDALPVGSDARRLAEAKFGRKEEAEQIQEIIVRASKLNEVEKKGQDNRAASQRALREAERAREKALDAELRAIADQGKLLREIADDQRRLRGADVSELFDRRFTGPSITDVISRGTLGAPVGQAELNELLVLSQKGAERAGLKLVEAGEKTARQFERDGIQAAANIAQAFGGRVGGEISRIAFLLSDVLGGEFASFGGNSSPVGRAFKSTFDPLTSEIEKLVDKIDIGLGGAGSSALNGALTGATIGSALGGNTESAIGGAVGGAAGSAIGFAVGGPIGAAIGNVIGSLIGTGIGGLFNSPKKGAAIIGSSGGEATIAGFSGNNSGQRSQAGTLGGSVVNTLNAIADQLGAQIGQFAVSIGKVNDTFSVDPTGRGNVSKRFGVTQFGTAEEAVRFAVLDAVRDGAFIGISQTVQNALRRAGDIEKGLQDALTIQSVADRVAQFEDPIGFAIRRLDREFDSLRKTLTANSATVEELNDLESLYNREREALVKDSLRTLTEFRDSLLAGGSSPLSLRAQQAEAQARFAAFEQDLSRGEAIDQQAFVAAGQLLLDVERQISGGTADFFVQFGRVQEATNRAIEDLQNTIPIRDQLAERTAVAGESTAQSLAEAVNLLQQINIELRAQNSGGGGPGSFDFGTVANGFARP